MMIHFCDIESKVPGAHQSARPEAAGDNRGQSPLKQKCSDSLRGSVGLCDR